MATLWAMDLPELRYWSSEVKTFQKNEEAARKRAIDKQKRRGK